ncbi:hypothetical protein BASA62_007611 [Batrachochytrium salamandrivorans]|nr:hypothetical protein BASA62_007611 [Batrachochytrium salamandrivorans]
MGVDREQSYNDLIVDLRTATSTWVTSTVASDPVKQFSWSPLACAMLASPPHSAPNCLHLHRVSRHNSGRRRRCCCCLCLHIPTPVYACILTAGGDNSSPRLRLRADVGACPLVTHGSRLASPGRLRRSSSSSNSAAQTPMPVSVFPFIAIFLAVRTAMPDSFSLWHTSLLMCRHWPPYIDHPHIRLDMLHKRKPLFSPSFDD